MILARLLAMGNMEHKNAMYCKWKRLPMKGLEHEPNHKTKQNNTPKPKHTKICLSVCLFCDNKRVAQAGLAGTQDVAEADLELLMFSCLELPIRGMAGMHGQTRLRCNHLEQSLIC